MGIKKKAKKVAKFTGKTVGKCAVAGLTKGVKVAKVVAKGGGVKTVVKGVAGAIVKGSPLPAIGAVEGVTYGCKVASTYNKYRKKEINGKEAIKTGAIQTAESSGSTAGAIGGAIGGGVAGAAVGSVVPVFGTAAGGIVGGIIGSFAGSKVVAFASKKVATVAVNI